MARLNHVKAARFSKKGRPKCGRCGSEIEIGQPYYWWANRLGRSSSKKVRCADHRPRPSEMQTSPYKTAAYAVQEDLEDVLASDFEPDEIAEALNTAAQTVRDDCAEALHEGAQNIVDGFGHETAQSEEMEERAQAFEEWADELESAASDVESVDWPERDTFDDDAFEEAVAAARDEVREIAEGVAGNCPE